MAFGWHHPWGDVIHGWSLIEICKSWLAYEKQLYQVPIDLAEQKITSFVLTSPNTKYRVFCTSERLLLFDWLFVISRKKSWKKKNDTTQILANLAFHVTCWAEWRRCIDHKDFCHCVPLSAQKIKTSARSKVHLKQQVFSKFYLELFNLAVKCWYIEIPCAKHKGFHA